MDSAFVVLITLIILKGMIKVIKKVKVKASFIPYETCICYSDEYFN